MSGKADALMRVLAKLKAGGQDLAMGKEIAGPGEAVFGPGKSGGSLPPMGLGREGMGMGAKAGLGALGAAGGIGAYEGLKEDDSPVEKLLKSLGLR